MIANKTTEEILAIWRNRIEINQEAGTTPLLTLGESASLLDGLPGLIAYHELAATRTDLTSPMVQAGGGGALWLAMLTERAPRAAEPLFTGVDAASVMAMETLYAHQAHSSSTFSRLDAPGHLPAGFVSYLAPTAVPGTALRWSALPTVIMNPASPQNETTSADWAAYAAVFLALCLILLALIV